MPRTAGAQSHKIDKSKPPQVQYEQLDPIDKYICFQFILNKRTQGAKGWNCDQDKKPTIGSVHHYRSSQAIIDNLSKAQFRHKAKVSVLMHHFSLRIIYPISHNFFYL